MSKDGKDPLVFVVIPNKNGVRHLQYSLKYLFESTYSNFKVVLVDNDSTDESLAYVRSNYESLVVLRNNGVKCFAVAVNVGIRYAIQQGASFIAIFSNDIKVRPTWIELALGGFSIGARVGLVGYTEVNRESEALFYNSNISEDTVRYSEVKGLPGCLYVCESGIFRTIGYYDEDYFMYGEDNDVFARLAKFGYKMVQSNVPVWHFSEGSSENHKFMVTWLAYRNAMRFAIKNERPLGIIRMMASLVNQGCNPFLRRRSDSNVFKRMRRYNMFSNLCIILGSLCWNLLHLGPTLHSRFELEKKIRLFRVSSG